MRQRQVLVERMRTKHEAARLKAIELRERYWTNKEQKQQRAVFVHRVCAQVLEQPITFLPKLPEAAQLARHSWAYDATATPDAREEALRLVHSLNDNVAQLSSALSAWQTPGTNKKFAQQMKASVADSRGSAPQARHFKKQSFYAVRNLDEDDDISAPVGAPAFRDLVSGAPAF